MEQTGSLENLAVPSPEHARDRWSRPPWIYGSALVLCGGSTWGSFYLFEWGAVPLLWVTPVCVLAAIALSWPRQRHRPERLLAVAVAVPLLLFVASFTISGLSWWQSAWMAAATSLQGVLMAALYWWWVGDRRWVPLTPGDLVRMVLSFASVSAVLVWLGVLPGTHPLALDLHNVLWLLRAVTDSCVGALTLPVLWWYPKRWAPTVKKDLAYLALLVPLALVMSYFLYHHSDIPTSWTVVFPALWAGWVLSPRGAAAYTFVTAVGILLMHLDLASRHSGEIVGGMPGSVLVEFMVLASSLTCLGFSLSTAQAVDLRESLAREREQAADQALMLSGVFNSMSDGVLVFERDGGPVVYNDTVSDLLGTVPFVPIDEWAASVGVLSEDGTPVSADDPVIKQLYKGRGTTRLALRVVDGRRMWLEVTLTPLGKTRALVVVRDVTLERQKADELRSFAGVVTHDLRTPLTGLHGWLEVLSDELDNTANPVVSKALASAMQSSGRLRTTIDDWLDFTVERDSRLNISELTVRDVVSEALAELGSNDVDVTISAPHRVMGDRAVLRQVFLNLGGNAVKYSRPRHPPTLHVRSSVLDDAPDWVVVEVRDNGRGVPEGEEEAIFAEFHRADEHAGHIEGSGVGLALCRRAIEKHGGTISASRNQDGPGSTFTLTLPAA